MEEHKIPERPPESELTYKTKWKKSYPWLVVEWKYLRESGKWVEHMICDYCRKFFIYKAEKFEKGDTTIRPPSNNMVEGTTSIHLSRLT